MPECANFQKICPFHKNRAVNLHFIMKNRPERLISFLVVWLTMFSCVDAWGQNSYLTAPKKDFSRISLPGTTLRRMSGNPDRTKGLDLTWGVIFARSMDS